MKKTTILTFMVAFAFNAFTQANQPIELSCNSNSTFSQIFDYYDDVFYAWDEGWLITPSADNYTSTLPFDQVTLWGGWLYYSYGSPDCTQEETETFSVEIYDEDPSLGATPLYSFIREGTLTPTGYIFESFGNQPLYQIEIDLGESIDVLEGWISINNTFTPDRPCMFGWLCNYNPENGSFLNGYFTTQSGRYWNPPIPGGLFFCLGNSCDENFANAGEDATIYYGYEPMNYTQLNASGGVLYSWSPATGLSNTGIYNPIACPTETTTYTVTVTDENGCESSDEVIVTVIDVHCGQNNNKVLICHVPPTNPNNPSTICVSPSAVPQLLAQGSYLGPCDNGKSGIVEDVKADEFSVNIFPNPFQDRCQIQVEQVIGNDLIIEVFDIFGKCVSKIHAGYLDGGTYQFDWKIPGIPEAVYLLKVRSGNEFNVMKLLTQ